MKFTNHFIVLTAIAACGLFKANGAGQSTPAQSIPSTVAQVDKSLSIPHFQAYRIKLLELAFEAASAIPVQPHIKDRSRSQAAIVETCLRLDQSSLALSFIARMEDWRKGACLADYAFYVVRHGDCSIEQHLAEAAAIAASATDWRQDRIKAKIARARVLLNQVEAFEQLASNISETEIGKVDQARAMIADEAEFDRQMQAIDAIVAQRNFDLTRNALESVAELFERFYADSTRRELAEQKIKSSWNSTPEMFRLELLSKLAETALAHHDQSKALALVNESQALLAQHQWSPEYEIVTAARIAAQRYAAGDQTRANADLETIVGWFESRRQMIMGIDRAGALRAVGESYARMQNAAASLRIFSRAVEEGADNPNARPRALDLAATCSSMALAGIEPDDELWVRLRQLRAELNAPW